jgi:GT2 family glycosyltransferase/glycosyltransferase involved in cell wall biosynthesis
MHRPGSRSSVDVIIPNWNGSRCIGPCLASLAAQSYPNLRVVVVDNGSTDDSLGIVRSRFPQVRVVEMGANAGFAAAVNRGIRDTDGDYVALLNNDAVADPEWIANLVDALDADPSLGSCASRMLVMNKPWLINVAGLAFSPSLRACSAPIAWGALDSYQHHVPYLVTAPSGGACMYRREALREVGLFDDDYFLYFEDFDLGIRLQLGGYDCLYVPDAVVYHDDEAIDRQHPDWILKLNQRNSRWTAVKCFPRFLVSYLALCDGISPGAAFMEGGDPVGRDAPREASLAPGRSLAQKRAAVEARTKISTVRLLHILRKPRRPYPRIPAPGPSFRVAIFSHSTDIAGTEYCMLRLAKALDASGIRPLAVLPKDPGPLAEEFKKARIEIATFDNAWWVLTPKATIVGRWILLGRSVRVGWQLSRLIRQMGIEAVGTITSVVPGGAIAARLAGVRHLWHVREIYPSEHLRPTLGLTLTRWLIPRLSSTVIVPSQKVAALFPDAANVQVVPEGIDARFFEVPKLSRTDTCRRLGLPSGPRLVAVVAALDASKDVLSAVRTLAALVGRGLDVSLVLCGGCYRHEYEHQVRGEVRRLGLEERVHFLGFRRDVLPVYDAADVLLVTSTRESFGLAVVEAMARGVPVVATRCGGPEEIIADRETGYLVDVGDTQAMAARIAALLADDALASAVAARAQAAAARFNPAENFAATLRSYGLTLGG